MATLERCGARPAEREFLSEMMRTDTDGLPSIDDAFAVLYNFYLLPVDEELIAARVHAFRFRDGILSTSALVSPDPRRGPQEKRIRGTHRYYLQEA